VVAGLAWIGSRPVTSYSFRVWKPAEVAIADGLISMIIFGLLGLAIWFPVRYLLKDDNQIYTSIFNVLLTGSLTLLVWLLRLKVPGKGNGYREDRLRHLLALSPGLQGNGRCADILHDNPGLLPVPQCLEAG
jgi:hypothetical protein